ncbi:MAG: HD domain-containing protein [Burkholderiales bacterium]|nr:HD domain-containing protein [Burkholderiales bacterium]
MSKPAASESRTTNPHALAIILEASETRSIIAASDIFDIKGILLWARNQPVTADLQRRLMDRPLQAPIESSLMAEDGIRPETLGAAVAALAGGSGPLAGLLAPRAALLQHAATGIRLHPVAQLLLTAVETARPVLFAHAVEAMAVAGALMAARESVSEPEVTLAMTAGLLHDIGEMYVAPEFGEADAARSLDVETYRQLVVHPHVGHLLLKQLTDYPAEVVQAVAEHHERLDGSGYPHRLRDDAISPLGRLLAVVEEALAALRAPGATLHHASVALRVVPHEFDVHLAGPLATAACALPPMAARRSIDDLRQRLQRLDNALRTAPERIEAAVPTPCSEPLRQTVDLVLGLVQRLREGWNESGLWSVETLDGEHLAEAEAVQDALRARLLEIGRVARLAMTAGADDDRACVERLCDILIEGLVRPV